MKKRTLIFTNFYKPGFLAGGPIQSVYNLCSLLSGTFDIRIITRNFDFTNNKNPYNLERNKWLDQENGVKAYYTGNFSYMFLSLSQLFQQKPEIIYINSFFSPGSQTNLFASKIYQLFHKCNIVIAPRGEFDEGALAIKSRKKTIFLKLFRIFYGSKIKFHATTEKEKGFIQLQFRSNEIIVAGNIPKTEKILTQRIKNPNVSKFVFLSRISPKKNLIFCLEILEKIKAEGTIEFTIVGPFEDESYWEKCRQKISSLPENVSCNAIGPLEHHKIEAILKEHHFLFFPTFAENFGHVIYESLIFGLPVLISTNTPWENGRNENGVFAHDLSEIDKFTNDLKYLHAIDQQQYNDLSENAFAYAKSKVDLGEIKEQYINLFKDA